MEYGGPAPRYWVGQPRTLAPLLVTVDVSFARGTLDGAAAHEWYLWIPGHAWRIATMVYLVA